MVFLGDVVSSGDVFSLGGRVGGKPIIKKTFSGYALVIKIIKYSSGDKQGLVFNNCKLLMPDGSLKYASSHNLNSVLKLGDKNEKS